MTVTFVGTKWMIEVFSHVSMLEGIGIKRKEVLEYFQHFFHSVQ